MKKVLFFIHNMEDGGAQKVLVHLVNNMDRKKFDITVLSLFGGGINESFLRSHVRYRAVFPRPIRGNSILQKLLSPEQLYRLCIKEQYDIVVSYLEGVSARIISGCPDQAAKTACWIHSTLKSADDGASCFRSVREAEEQYSQFQRILCVSQWTRRAFCSAFPSIDRVEVQYNTVESEEILRLAREPASGLPSGEGRIRLIAVGGLKPVKALDRLLRIHARLREAGYPVHTCLVGQGPDKEALMQQTRELGVEDTVSFLGFQTNPYQYVAKCDLFVCSSHSEGFSTAVTESLIVGTPVCTVDVAGMKEMLGENNEWGIVTENSEDALYEGIKGLLADPEKLAHYREKAAERGKWFSTEETVRATEEMLLNL